MSKPSIPPSRRRGAPSTAMVLILAAAMTPLPAAPVSHFAFDDPADVGLDSGPLARHGSIAGNARHSADAKTGSGALRLDGDGDHLVVGGAAAYSALAEDGDGFTVSAWIRPDSLLGVRRVFSTAMPGGFTGDGWGCGFSSASPFATTYGVADFNADTDRLVAGTWQHVAWVYQPAAGTIRFHVDGERVAETSGAAGLRATTSDFIIGGLALPSSPQWFAGLIDDLRIDDRELDDAAIAALAALRQPIIESFIAAPAPLAEPGPVTLAWSARDAETLTLTASGRDDLEVTGTSTATIPDVMGTTTFTLVAEAGAARAQRSIVVAVAPDPAPPRIGEFMAANEATIADEDGDFSDWIEVHNPNDFHFGIGGWCLTDDSSDLGQWRFPALLLPPDGRLVVFASGKDRTAPGGELHTGFRLDAEGEFLALVDPAGTVVQAFDPAFPPQTADISFGPDPSGGPEGAWFLPTPGTPNGPPLADLPPILDDLTRDPPAPAPGTDLPVTVRVTTVPGEGPPTVTLTWRIGYDGETATPMHDDGTGNDATAGDGIFTAAIPGNAFAGGEMIRWFATATSPGGSTSRVPAFTDPQASAEYHGTVAVDDSIESPLPVLHWFVRNERASETRTGTQASLFFDGRFYDNVFCRIRGQSAGSWPKHKFKFDFYKGGRFRWAPDEPAVEEFNLQSFYREVFGQSSNTSYMREPLMFRWMEEAGASAPESFHLHVRRNGGFYGLFAFVEQVDETFLERRGYDPDGSMYKAAWQGGGPATLSPNPQPGQYRKVLGPDDAWDDFRAFCAGINASNPDRFRFVWDHVDVAQWLNVMAAMDVPFNHDQLTKNYYAYREPRSGEWHRFPWDGDQSFPVGQYITGENWTSPLYGDARHTQELAGGSPNPAWQNHMHAAILDNPVTREMYLRRVRSLADRYLAEVAEASSTVLVSVGAPARILVPVDGSLDAAWMLPGFDDTNWHEGPGGFGFETIAGEYAGLIGTRVRPRETDPSANSLLARYRFDVDDPGAFETLVLRMKFDDGFVAYLNGNEVARDNVTGEPTWNTTTGSRGPDTLNDQWAEYRLEGALDRLEPGTNVLAIRVLNSSPANSDLLVLPELVAGEASYFESLVQQTRALIESDADADRAFWATRGVTLSPIESGVREILETALPARRRHLFETYGPAGSGLVPGPQPADATLAFGRIEFDPPGGNQDEEFVELRNPNDFAVDLSGWTLGGGVTHRFQPGTVIPSNGRLFVSPDKAAFRARSASPRGGESLFVQGDYQGHLSSFGERLELMDEHGRLVAATEYEGNPSPVQQFLVVSEIMFDPGVGHPDAEFVELMNIHPTEALDLSGTVFTDGIDYAFPEGFTLEAGARTLVVLDRSAFEAVHGTELPIAGTFASGRLDNGGEFLKLEDAASRTVAEFSYDDDPPWPGAAGGGGYSLTLITPEGRPDPANPANWRTSAFASGSPGSSDTLPPFDGDGTTDADGNGIADLLQHATGSDQAELVVATAAAIGGDARLVLEHGRDLRADDVTLVVETTRDLVAWETAAPDARTETPDGTGRAVVRLELGIPGDGTPLFVRLRAVHHAPALP